MKKIKWILLLGLFIAVTGFAKPVSPVEVAYALIERVTPGYGDQFVLELISAQERLCCGETIRWHWLLLSINI